MGGMAATGAVGVEPDDYDAAHEGVHESPLMRRLWAEAMGEEYPAEVEPFSACSWWLLGHVVASLRMRPGGRLVDLGCGRGGPGLWLARALSARLVGIDFSPVAVRLASARAGDFVPPGRAEFRQATIERTGLPDGCADGIVSVDAFPFTPDRVAAFREVRRILVPGGRIALTVLTPADQPDRWATMAEPAGLQVEESLVNPHHREPFRRLFELWQAHERGLRAELGDRATDNLIREARSAPSLPESVPLLLVLRSPEDPMDGG
jgi:ubiquinone/menaquinone biosynthesis C-methylase UbiE